MFSEHSFTDMSWNSKVNIACLLRIECYYCLMRSEMSRRFANTDFVNINKNVQHRVQRKQVIEIYNFFYRLAI